ncbi:NitT/TauT family transport system permease protein [Murinocardiopsis flavida]|uniref:NitT/TauT family transport system permease protein n=1 Tax=Murinocardiopsis flavida TaxID=645275 RepID=A0A2P8DTU3_9ACTN|nr:ABC transporter permease [Murinocardiopsis flavida]PSL00629.1 NitT/TauT family transport system permease protein [Murinocardiopsis flavida]
MQQTATPATGPPDGAARARPRRGGWAALPVAPRRAALLLLILGVWQGYVSLSGVSPLLVSGPADVAAAIYAGIADGRLLAATAITLQVLLSGMVIGMALAAVLTTLASWSRLGDDLLVLLTSMLNPLPAIAILPLAILWFGLSTTALVFVITNAVVWPIAINVSTGFRTVNPTIMAVGRNIGLRGWRIVRDVLIPAALPQIIAGLKTGWAFGWRTIIAAELVFGAAGGQGGLGFFINDARYFLRTPEVFAGLVTIALIGIALDLVFTWIERRTVIRWGMKST